MRFTLRTIGATAAIAFVSLTAAAPAHAYTIRTRAIDSSGSIISLSTGDNIGDATARINHHKLAAGATLTSELPAGTYEVNYLFSDVSNTQSILHPSVTHVCTLTIDVNGQGSCKATVNMKRLPTSRDTVAMSIVPTGSELIDLVAIAFLTTPPGVGIA